MQIGQGHSVNIFRRPLDATKVGTFERKSTIGNHRGTKAQVTCCTSSRFYRVVGADTYDDERGVSSGMQPTFKSCVDKRIRDIFLDDMFVCQRAKLRLKLNARLARPERRARCARDVADMHY